MPATVIGVSAFGVCSTLSLPPSSTSQAQPLPNCVTAALARSSLNLAKSPKSDLIMSSSLPVGWPPPFGLRLFQ